VLNQHCLEFPEIVRLETTENFHVLFGHFEWRTLEVQASWTRLKDESEVDMKDAAILPYHYIGIIAIFQIEHVLDETKTRIRFSKFGQN
jgi:hypothetical protein